MRWQSIAYMIAMSIGAAVYDPALMQRVADSMGFEMTITQELTLRLPALLTFAMAILTLAISLRMTDPVSVDQSFRAGLGQCGRSGVQALAMTLKAGKWLLKTPFALAVILAAVLFDHIARMVMTLNSQYFRLIHLPEASFGLIGSGMALMGLVIPPIALKLTQTRTPVFNLWLLAGMSMLGLVGLTFFWPYVGLVPVVMLVGVMYLQRFYSSHYLNRLTDSSQRATVLSFKGLSMNLAYGAAGILYSVLLAFLKGRIQIPEEGPALEALENTVFIQSMAWFPGYFLVALVVLVLFLYFRLRRQSLHKQIG